MLRIEKLAKCHRPGQPVISAPVLNAPAGNWYLDNSY